MEATGANYTDGWSESLLNAVELLPVSPSPLRTRAHATGTLSMSRFI